MYVLTQLSIKSGATGTPLEIARDLDGLTDETKATMLLAHIDESHLTGGFISVIDAVSTMFGSGRTIVGLNCGHGVDPINQRPSDFANPVENPSVKANSTSVGTALTPGGAGNVSVFSANSDTLTCEHTSQFDSIAILLDTPSSESCELVWEYRYGSGTWHAFSPIDGTNGFQQTGVVSWEPEHFDPGPGGVLQIKATRTKTTLTTTPIVDSLLFGLGSLGASYYWTKSGDIYAKSINAELLTQLGTFTGSTIPDNQTPKQALQALETEIDILQSSGFAVLGGVVLSTTDWTDVPSGTISLPAAGTYEIHGAILGYINNTNATASIEIKLYNTTDAADVTNSTNMVVRQNVGTGLRYGSTPYYLQITVAAAKTLKFQARRTAVGTYTTAGIDSASYGQSTVGWRRIY